MTGPQGPQPASHLVWSILSTLFCCLPLGVVSIVFAAQVNTKWETGDQVGAVAASRRARQFAIGSAVVGVAGVTSILLLGFPLRLISGG